ncbi:unnamed protein product [Amoebophrya sp. A120]|nr:unnamed protein product [Amoebophrya sp. A120]|eukprot:GSA120T00015964001.1
MSSPRPVSSASGRGIKTGITVNKASSQHQPQQLVEVPFHVTALASPKVNGRALGSPRVGDANLAFTHEKLPSVANIPSSSSSSSSSTSVNIRFEELSEEMRSIAGINVSVTKPSTAPAIGSSCSSTTSTPAPAGNNQHLTRRSSLGVSKSLGVTNHFAPLPGAGGTSPLSGGQHQNHAAFSMTNYGLNNSNKIIHGPPTAAQPPAPDEYEFHFTTSHPSNVEMLDFRDQMAKKSSASSDHQDVVVTRFPKDRQKLNKVGIGNESREQHVILTQNAPLLSPTFGLLGGVTTTPMQQQNPNGGLSVVDGVDPGSNPNLPLVWTANPATAHLFQSPPTSLAPVSPIVAPSSVASIGCPSTQENELQGQQLEGGDAEAADGTRDKAASTVGANLFNAANDQSSTARTGTAQQLSAQAQQLTQDVQNITENLKQQVLEKENNQNTTIPGSMTNNPPIFNPNASLVRGTVSGNLVPRGTLADPFGVNKTANQPRDYVPLPTLEVETLPDFQFPLTMGNKKVHNTTSGAQEEDAGTVPTGKKTGGAVPARQRGTKSRQNNFGKDEWIDNWKINISRVRNNHGTSAGGAAASSSSKAATGGTAAKSGGTAAGTVNSLRRPRTTPGGGGGLNKVAGASSSSSAAGGNTSAAKTTTSKSKSIIPQTVISLASDDTKEVLSSMCRVVSRPASRQVQRQIVKLEEDSHVLPQQPHLHSTEAEKRHNEEEENSASYSVGAAAISPIEGFVVGQGLSLLGTGGRGNAHHYTQHPHNREQFVHHLLQQNASPTGVENYSVSVNTGAANSPVGLVAPGVLAVSSSSSGLDESLPPARSPPMDQAANVPSRRPQSQPAPPGGEQNATGTTNRSPGGTVKKTLSRPGSPPRLDLEKVTRTIDLKENFPQPAAGPSKGAAQHAEIFSSSGTGGPGPETEGAQICFEQNVLRREFEPKEVKPEVDLLQNSSAAVPPMQGGDSNVGLDFTTPTETETEIAAHLPRIGSNTGKNPEGNGTPPDIPGTTTPLLPGSSRSTPSEDPVALSLQQQQFQHRKPDHGLHDNIENNPLQTTESQDHNKLSQHNFSHLSITTDQDEQPRIVEENSMITEPVLLTEDDNEDMHSGSSFNTSQRVRTTTGNNHNPLLSNLATNTLEKTVDDVIAAIQAQDSNLFENSVEQDWEHVLDNNANPNHDFSQQKNTHITTRSLLDESLEEFSHDEENFSSILHSVQNASKSSSKPKNNLSLKPPRVVTVTTSNVKRYHAVSRLPGWGGEDGTSMVRDESLSSNTGSDGTVGGGENANKNSTTSVILGTAAESTTGGPQYQQQQVLKPGQEKTLVPLECQIISEKLLSDHSLFSNAIARNSNYRKDGSFISPPRGVSQQQFLPLVGVGSRSGLQSRGKNRTRNSVNRGPVNNPSDKAAAEQGSGLNLRGHSSSRSPRPRSMLNSNRKQPSPRMSNRTSFLHSSTGTNFDLLKDEISVYEHHEQDEVAGRDNFFADNFNGAGATTSTNNISVELHGEQLEQDGWKFAGFKEKRAVVKRTNSSSSSNSASTTVDGVNSSSASASASASGSPTTTTIVTNTISSHNHVHQPPFGVLTTVTTFEREKHNPNDRSAVYQRLSEGRPSSSGQEDSLNNSLTTSKSRRSRSASRSPRELVGVEGGGEIDPVTGRVYNNQAYHGVVNNNKLDPIKPLYGTAALQQQQQQNQKLLSPPSNPSLRSQLLRDEHEEQGNRMRMRKNGTVATGKKLSTQLESLSQSLIYDLGENHLHSLSLISSEDYEKDHAHLGSAGAFNWSYNSMTDPSLMLGSVHRGRLDQHPHGNSQHRHLTPPRSKWNQKQKDKNLLQTTEFVFGQHNYDKLQDNLHQQQVDYYQQIHSYDLPGMNTTTDVVSNRKLTANPLLNSAGYSKTFLKLKKSNVQSLDFKLKHALEKNKISVSDYRRFRAFASRGGLKLKQRPAYEVAMIEKLNGGNGGKTPFASGKMNHDDSYRNGTNSYSSSLDTRRPNTTPGNWMSAGGGNRKKKEPNLSLNSRSLQAESQATDLVGFEEEFMLPPHLLPEFAADQNVGGTATEITRLTRSPDNAMTVTISPTDAEILDVEVNSRPHTTPGVAMTGGTAPGRRGLLPPLNLDHAVADDQQIVSSSNQQDDEAKGATVAGCDAEKLVAQGEQHQQYDDDHFPPPDDYDVAMAIAGES